MEPSTSGPQVSGIERYLIRRRGWLAFWAFVIAFSLGVSLLPRGSSLKNRQHIATMQQVRQIGQVLFSYAQDHGGQYPSGKSSTDIFQQLIDQNYVTDPSIFYFPMDGKTPATSNHLKPENVCFDVTNGVRSDDSDLLPVVFSTGYKVDYAPAGKAHSLLKVRMGITVYYKGNNAFFLFDRPNGVPLIPQNFDPKGRSYQQLTPTGPLP